MKPKNILMMELEYSLFVRYSFFKCVWFTVRLSKLIMGLLNLPIAMSHIVNMTAIIASQIIYK